MKTNLEPLTILVKKYKVERNPSEAKIKAGNYLKAHTVLDGLRITIENPQGSTRSGKNKEGVCWSTTMLDHYGYLKGVRGADKDHLDIFLSPNAEENQPIFIINQKNIEDGKFDEHKIMIGYKSKEEATKSYLQNYEDCWMGFDSIEEVTKQEFMDWTSKGVVKNKFQK